MQPLIDGDILLHELGWSGQFKDKETGEEVLLDVEHVLDLLDKKIKLICEDVDATEPPIIYITDSEELTQRLNRYRKWQGEPLLEYEPLFRYEIAKTRPYKGNRKNPKPEHFYNILFYLLAEYDTRVARYGLEADDMMCIEQAGRSDTIICSRDKDLRICPGWHFSWECGKQAAIGPTKTDKIGWLELRDDGKVLGYGLSFFYFQMLVGDTADYIPGLKGVGEVKAYKLLSELTTEKELFSTVKQAYIDVLGKEEAKEMFLEQANLLWMIQEKGVGYVFPRLDE